MHPKTNVDSRNVSWLSFLIFKEMQMKRGFVTLLLVLVLSTFAWTQEDKIIEPDYYSVFYFVGESGQAVELERQIERIVPKFSETLIEFPGEKSPTRLKAGTKMEFIVRVTEDIDDARSTIQLFRFQVKDGMRQMSITGPGSMNGATIRLSGTRYGGSSLKLAPYQSLSPGEYSLSRTTIIQGFCFGIDPS
jgi:hypothetical protein